MKAASAAGSRHKKRHIGQFVSDALPARRGPAAGAAARASGGCRQPGAEGQPRRGAGRLDGDPFAGISNVQIEILDDVIIVSGRKEDVEKVLQIIEEIERQSLETRPEVESTTSSTSMARRSTT